MSAFGTSVKQPRGFRSGTFNTTSTSYVTALSISGAGRLAFLYGSTSQYNYMRVRITIDGVVVINDAYVSGDSSNSGAYLAPDGVFQYNSTSRPYVPLDIQFKQSLLIEVYSASSSYNCFAKFGWEA
ncbi:hypothetical protein JJB07_14935 [Tumebacillus sp. ITR2]|uniref:Uncharacterized protein n=1 Tax=Tumebacillus amylolyticus TaxID=2801339 RepID=A0ABS1JD38_9BACL|nr:hypothetical protein [Tumebacillus amylolyticus]MBL0387934.1 hypothetical protein [Tumebacillus amylolyticus]